MPLTDPVTLAGRHAPSRVMFGPHVTNLGDRRDISPRHVAYYERRAAGGAGIIVTEAASVHSDDWPYERAPLATRCAHGWASTVAASRPHGALVIAGLGHAGGQGSSAYSQAALWAPARVADVVSRELPMEMELPEIEELVAGFGDAAALAVRAGLDGVEINAGQHSLVRQFLSGLTNTRADPYGADRTLLLREVLAAVRRAVGADHVLGLRLCCDELAPWAGITPDAASALAAELAPRLDYLVVVRGSAMSVSATTPDLHTEPAFNVELCRSVAAAVAGTTPVVLQGSVVDVGQADAALRDGVADVVEMTRAQIADPDLVARCRAGERERVRPCVLCNQKCRVRDVRNPIVSCVGEPRSGHETVDPVPVAPAAADPLDALVVGGGPAGMEAARVLAAGGHRVELVERGAALGGMLRVAAGLAGRGRLRLLADWLAAELARLGVTVRLATGLTGADLDAAVGVGRRVLLATGSVPGPRGYVVDGAAVVDAAQLLTDTAGHGRLPAGGVLVFDPLGDAVGVGVAELLAAAGRRTSIVTPDRVVGARLAATGDLADAGVRLRRAGVEPIKGHTLREARAGTAIVEDTLTGRRREVECAAVVHCGHRLPEASLHLARPDLPLAGDCVAPRTVYEAVLEGRRAALELATTQPRERTRGAA